MIERRLIHIARQGALMENNDPEIAMQNIGIVGMEPCIEHILRKTACQPRAEVKAELAEVDFEVLQDNSKLLFSHARRAYEEQLRQNNIKNIVEITPKLRRNASTASSDIIDLYLYVIGVREDFPRHAIKDLSVFREKPLSPEETDEDDDSKLKDKDECHDNNKENGGQKPSKDDAVDDEFSAGDEGSEVDGSESSIEYREEEDEVEQESEETVGESNHNNEQSETSRLDAENFDCPCKGCEKCADEFQKLWAYLLNVEKISTDRITALEKSLCKASANQNCKTSQHKQKESRQTESSKTKESKNNGGQGTSSSSPATDKMPEYQNEPGASTSSHPQEGNLKKNKTGLFPRQNKTGENQNMGDTPSENTNERPAQNDSKHYQVGGDSKFPNKIKRKELTSAATLNKSNGNRRTGSRILTSAAGFRKPRTAELYLPNIAKHDGDSLKDIAEMVRERARKGGLYVITSRVVQNRYNRNIVGCRITVPERQMDDALGNRVWPRGMKARKWNPEKPVNERKKPTRFQNGKCEKDWGGQGNDYWPEQDQEYGQNNGYWHKQEQEYGQNNGYWREQEQEYGQNNGYWHEQEQEENNQYYYGENEECYEDEYQECEDWEDRYQEETL